MGQKKGVDLLVVLRNLLHQRQELRHQRQHQTGFASRDHGIGLQMGLVQPLNNGRGYSSRIGMFRFSQDLLDLFRRSGCRLLWGWIRLQEGQRTLLLQLRKKIQCHGIIRFEAGCKLIHQTGLCPDQAILIAGEQFEFGDLLASLQ